ncbi:MAG: FAD-binding oxidoreductase [Armatimonadetes bacterium]|nr:FAD-binding oxidoreductase [Armatimonadota bacterium]
MVTVEQIASILRANTSITTLGERETAWMRGDWADHADFVHPLPSIPTKIDVAPADLTVTITGSATWAELRVALTPHSLWIPHPAFLDDHLTAHSDPGSDTIAGSLALNLPHAFESRFGSWRDWILGAQMVLADGTIARSGSKVVKSVAGYDLHKLLVGARGAYAFVTEVTLRAWARRDDPPAIKVLQSDVPAKAVLRSLPSVAPQVRDTLGNSIVAEDSATCTFWVSDSMADFAPDPRECWILRQGCGNLNFALTSVQSQLARRTMDALDPTHKINRGALLTP